MRKESGAKSGGTIDLFFDLYYTETMIGKVDFSPYAKKRFCVALSGGADSVALLYAALEAADKYDISVSAVNVEHGIRGEESLEDTRFVKTLCEKEDVPLYLYAADIPRIAQEKSIGLEEAARQYRYAAYEEVLNEKGEDFVATAHHAGDNAESVLFHLFRGSALRGVSGIRPVLSKDGQKGIVRPFLSVTKEEILQYLRERGICWREDSSNADISYSRNFLRRNVLGAAKEQFPACEKRIYAFSCAAREDDEYLYKLASEKLLEQDGAVKIEADAPRPLFLRACLLALQKLGVDKDYTGVNFEAIRSLCGAQNGTGADVLQGVRAVKEYGKIALYRPEETGEALVYPFAEGEFAFGTTRVKIVRGEQEAEDSGKVLYLDADRLPDDCVLRLRREGDRFKKFGGGRKKLKDFLIEKKIPRRERDNLPLIASGQEIYAVCGVEISDLAKVAAESDGQKKKFLSGNVYSVLVYKEGE